MKRIFAFIFIILLSISLAGCAARVSGLTGKTEQPKQDNTVQTGKSDEEAAISLVKDFGSKLQMVSLLAPEDILKKSMQENYGQYVAPALIEKWLKDPQNAPGRLTSSPWPDRIEILSTNKLSDSEYEVKGDIVEVTSVEKANGGAAAKRPVTLTLDRTDNHWLITDVKLEAYKETSSSTIIYRNTEYGFEFSLPGSWKGYKIIADKWEGLAFDETSGQKVVETGPLLSIRHPEWTEKNPRQDIPIMIFTISQWNALQQDKFHIGAAPVGPRELGRNNKYVFALPARYNFAFPEGYEEVEKILNSNALHPITK